MPPVSINEKKLLIVEGQDEAKLCSKIIRERGIQGIQVIDVGGKDKFATLVPTICKTSGFADVISIGFIRDADNDSAAAFNSLRGIITKCALTVPKELEAFHEKDGLRVGVFISPGGGRPGMLEDLFLETISAHPLSQSVTDFVDKLAIICPTNATGEIFRLAVNRQKAMVQSALCATPRPFNQLGIAAEAGYWDIDHPSLKRLVGFVCNI